MNHSNQTEEFLKWRQEGGVQSAVVAGITSLVQGAVIGAGVWIVYKIWM